MGYNTSVDGEIMITPPLTWAEIKKSPFIQPGHISNLDVRLVVAEESVDTEDGQLIRKTASRLVPSWGESYKAYHLIEHVQQAVDAFPGHAFTGRLDCEGEDNADIWRVVIRDGRVTEVRPEIVWPEGAE